MDANGIGDYSAFTQYVIAIGMYAFAINFTIYYLMIFFKFKEIWKNEELKAFFIIVAVSVSVIAIDIFFAFKNLDFL